jgi:DNA helicase II / ATP-dependent DNA helicase PcrA
MTYKPGEEQQEIIDADDPVLLVCGGAGTGKTTTAAAAVRAYLERVDRERAATAQPRGRERVPVALALFLSFSRSSVAQILDRTAGVLGPYQSRVEITTFHAFAWRLLVRWGAVIGLADPQMLTDTEAKLFRADDAVRYKDMLPRALDLCGARGLRTPAGAVVDYRQRRVPGHRRPAVRAVHHDPWQGAAAAAWGPQPVHLQHPARCGRRRP